MDRSWSSVIPKDLQLNMPTPLYLSKMLFTDVQLLLYSKKKTTTTTTTCLAHSIVPSPHAIGASATSTRPHLGSAAVGLSFSRPSAEKTWLTIETYRPTSLSWHAPVYNSTQLNATRRWIKGKETRWSLYISPILEIVVNFLFEGVYRVTIYYSNRQAIPFVYTVCGIT